MKLHILRRSGKVGSTLALAAALCVSASPLHAQTSPPPAAAAASSEQGSDEKLSPEDLNDLLGPIALYPDALVALILPASTVPSDITIAARYLEQNGNDANVDDQPWDESVKGLARYPDVLKWMDQNLEWTNSLGEAFVEQPADVMNAIQTLRGEAKDKGNLVNTPQQTVVVEKQTQEIRIVPTQPDVIYVPQYDPEVVYVQPYQPDYVTPLVTFGVGFAAGAWLNYDCDWRGRDIYYGRDCGWNNHDRWNDRGSRDGNVNIVNTNTTINNTNINNFVNNSNARRWQASPQSRRQFNERQRQHLGNARIARANAAVRQSNKGANSANNRVAATRAAHVPKPARLKASTRKNAAARQSGTSANVGSKPNGTNKAKGNTNHRPKPTSAAPVVNGQSGSKKSAGGNGPSKHAGNRNSANDGGQSKAKSRQPSAAPSNPNGNSHKSGNADRPKQGNTTSSQKSSDNHQKVQKSSQASQSKPQGQRSPEQNPSPKKKKSSASPQQSATRSKSQAQPQRSQARQPSSKPHAQTHSGSSSSGSQQQSQGNNKKKKKKDSN